LRTKSSEGVKHALKHIVFGRTTSSQSA